MTMVNHLRYHRSDKISNHLSQPLSREEVSGARGETQTLSTKIGLKRTQSQKEKEILRRHQYQKESDSEDLNPPQSRWTLAHIHEH